MKTALGISILLSLSLSMLACSHQHAGRAHVSATHGANQIHKKEFTLRVHYLEIVTPNMDETCGALAEAHGIVFGEPVAELGNARTAALEHGGRIGVRAPMRETEEPVVRPYILVDEIEAAVEGASDAGAEIALPPTEIPGQGTIAIYILGGIQHGFWQQ